MVIGFNAKAAFTNNKTGIDEYVYWVIKTLINRDFSGNKYIFYTDKLPKNQTLNDFFNAAIPDFIEIKVLQSKYLWTQGRLAYELFINPPDIFFTPAHVLPLTAPKKSVITIHDLAYEYYPELYSPFSPFGFHYLRQVTKSAVKRAAKIIAVSENTKKDIVNLYNINPLKISVIYHGAPQLKSQNKESERIQLKNADKNPYILFIGRIELKKNIKNLVLSFNLLNDKLLNSGHKTVGLYLVGNPGYGYEKIAQTINLSPYRKNIFLLGHLQGKEKENILKNAAALALVSYYEGFGLPIIEAQSAGVPIVCSAISSLPEVAGHGALFCAPNNIKAMADCFYKILTNHSIKTKLVKRGFENSNRFSWDKCVDETLETLLHW